MKTDIRIIDTHAHLDGEEFSDDIAEVVERAKEAGLQSVLIPGVDASSVASVMALCRQYPGYLRPMIGLQPEEVRDDWRDVLRSMRNELDSNLASSPDSPLRYIAIGECGLDFYWSREFEQEQLEAFEEQVRWSVDTRLPLMIHCRKAQQEMLQIMRPYADQLPGGVFHCFTGNTHEAEAFLSMPRFCLGVGGVSTFKSSHLREDLPSVVPLDRLVLETDSPYMAPVPHRGKRNEPAFTADILQTLATAYGVTPQELGEATSSNAERLFAL